MIRFVQAAVLAAALVYPVYSHAQPAPAPRPAMSHTSAPAPAMAAAPMATTPVMAPAAMVPVAAPAMTPVAAPQPAAEAMKPAPAPAMATEPPKAAAPKTEPVAATPAPAAAPAAPKVSGWDTADTWIKRITSLILLLLSVIGTILGWTKAKDWREKLKQGRWAKVLQYARDYAFPAIERIAQSTEWKGDDKLAEFLVRVDDWLKGEQDKPLSSEEMALLKREAADLAAADKADDPEKAVDEKAVTRRKVA